MVSNSDTRTEVVANHCTSTCDESPKQNAQKESRSNTFFTDQLLCILLQL